MGTLEQRWQRLSRRQQAIVLAVVGVLTLWGVDALVFRPLLRGRLSELKRQARDAEQRLVDATIASAQADAVSQAFEAYRLYIKPAGSVESELAAVLTEVEAVVRETGLVQLGLKSVPERNPAMDRVSITLETEGSPTQLMRLLDRLQRSTLLLRVTELTVRTSESQTLRGSLVISKLLLHDS